MGMRPYFIINPVAGAGTAEDKFAAVKASLDAAEVGFGCVRTEREHQSAELAKQAYADGERLIIAVGGDGTVNEVASALYDKKDAVMGIMPFGTGNDFAKAINMPCEPERAAEVLLAGKTSLIDMGLANDTPFINVGGIGFDVDVVINTEKYKSRFRGMLPYLMGIMSTLFHIKKIPVTVTADGIKESLDILLCAAANGTHFGGGMKVAPEADPTDGKFDVCLVKATNLFRLLYMLPGFTKGRHLKSKIVKYFRASELTIDCERLPLQLDGELGQFAPVTFRILPSALRMITP